MTETTPIESKNSDTLNSLRHPAEYLEFVQWTAMPESLRNPKTQRELAIKFGIGEDVLSDWKNRDGFWDEVRKEMKIWGRYKTPDVVAALYNKALKGHAPEVKLWLEYVENWAPRQEINERSQQVIYELAPGSDTEITPQN